jgi:chromosome segregation ATPase
VVWNRRKDNEAKERDRVQSVTTAGIEAQTARERLADDTIKVAIEELNEIIDKQGQTIDRQGLTIATLEKSHAELDGKFKALMHELDRERESNKIAAAFLDAKDIALRDCEKKVDTLTSRNNELEEMMRSATGAALKRSSTTSIVSSGTVDVHLTPPREGAIIETEITP